MKTGFTLHVNVTRLVLYVAMAGLSYVGELPLWAMPALLLYDINYYAVYSSPTRRRLLNEMLEAQQQQWTQGLIDVSRMPGTQVDE